MVHGENTRMNLRAQFELAREAAEAEAATVQTVLAATVASAGQPAAAR